MRRFGTAAVAILAGLAAMAGTAHAQAALSITPAKACYLAGDIVSLSGSGFTPNGTVNVAIDGRPLQGGQALADAAGNIAGDVRLGTMRGARTHTMSATDAANPALVGSVSYLGTTNRVTVRPQDARAGAKRRLRGFGFLAGPRVYMHVRGPGGYRSDKRVARAKAPCGTFDVRRRIVASGAQVGSYRVQFDAVRRFSRKTRPRLVGTMNVTLRAAGARASLFGGASLAQSWTNLGG